MFVHRNIHFLYDYTTTVDYVRSLYYYYVRYVGKRLSNPTSLLLFNNINICKTKYYQRPQKVPGGEKND